MPNAQPIEAILDEMETVRMCMKKFTGPRRQNNMQTAGE